MARLLIVEDDPDTNDSICEYLKGAGHQFLIALTEPYRNEFFTVVTHNNLYDCLGK